MHGAYQYAREQGAEGEDEGYCWAVAVSMYRHGFGVEFFTKKPLKYSTVDTPF